jgi:hypothetical protein
MPHHSENVMDICVRVIRAASIGLGVKIDSASTESSRAEPGRAASHKQTRYVDLLKLSARLAHVEMTTIAVDWEQQSVQLSRSGDLVIALDGSRHGHERNQIWIHMFSSYAMRLI